jgi:amino acid adenylation domain-containing protein
MVRHMSADRCVHTWVVEQAARTADAIALRTEAGCLSYRGLDEASNRIAHHLRALGVGPEVLVALCLERSLELVPVILGVLKAGGAYVPLDPTDPPGRLRALLADCKPRVLLTHERLRPTFETLPLAVRAVDGLGIFADDSAASPSSAVVPDNLAYVIYTSGSTGTPKAVMCTHRALVDTLEWGRSTYALAATDRIPLKTPYTFDPSLLELFWPLMVGGTIVVARPDGHKDPIYLADLIRTSGITIAQFVPSALRALLEVEGEGVESLRSLRLLIVGGEALPLELHDRLLSLVELVNHYGPTETSIDAAVWRCRRDPGRTVVPIGGPVADTRLDVVDSELRPVPTGVAGELLIGGARLARGYLHRPGLTAERFVPDPLGPPGERRYRTGDLVRQDADGNLEFLGRLDHQIKIRGFRVELGEIEVILGQHDAVCESAVVPREEAPGEPHLVAYIVPRGPEAPSVPDLRDHLHARLPEHMVPEAFVFVDALPRSSAEKVDRAALAARSVARSSDRAVPPTRRRAALLPQVPYVAPSGAVEQAIAAVWQDVLAVDAIGAQDRFLDLGGESLRATRATLRLRELLGRDVPIVVMLQNASVAELAVQVGALSAHAAGPQPGARPRGAAVARRPTVRSGRFPATRAQSRFWMEAQLGFDNAMPELLELEGPLDLRALRLSLDLLVKRHAALRTTFDVAGSDVLQTIGLPVPASIEVLDLCAEPPERRDERAMELVADRSRVPFDLQRGPVFRTHVMRLAPDRHWILWNLHHIVGDHVSIFLLYEELGALYRGFVTGSPATLPPIEVDAVDVARLERFELPGEETIAYWRRALDGQAPPLDLPVARSRGERKTLRGGVCPIDMSQRPTDGLRALAITEGVTFHMAVLSALFALLHRYSEREDLVIGVPATTRERIEYERTVGNFVNLLPVRLQVTGTLSFRQLLARVRATTLEAYRHKHMPFDRIIAEVAPRRSAAHNPLYQVLLELARDGEVSLHGLRVRRPWPPHPGRQLLDLSFVLSEEDHQVWGELAYNADLFDADAAAGIAEHFVVLIEHAVTTPDLMIAELAMTRD